MNIIKGLGYCLGFIWDGHIRVGSVDSFIKQLKKNGCKYVEAVPYVQEGDIKMGNSFGVEGCNCYGYFATKTAKGRPILLKTSYGKRANIYILPNAREDVETRAQTHTSNKMVEDITRIQGAVPGIEVKIVNPNAIFYNEEPSFERLRRLNLHRDILRLRTGLVGILGG